MDDIPLLKHNQDAGNSIWISRSCDELSREISSRYGLPVDLSSRAGGLSAIARALNADDVALAQIATVQLAIPAPPPLSKGVPSRQALEQFIRELSSSGLLNGIGIQMTIRVGPPVVLTVKVDSLHRRAKEKSMIQAQNTPHWMTILDRAGARRDRLRLR
ncbi:MAG TPA: hypothetical protein VHY79_03270 [Rhizomicrobium sp.]|nr:hypothetical protein [Rhizomicrobium sp.]